MKKTRLPILLVEDSDDDVLLMERALRETGIANPLHRVASGQEAIDYLSGIGPFADRENFPLPCMVLLDLQLPFKNGIEVLQWIRSQPALQTLIVIVLTSSAHRKDVTAAYAMGARSYLVKPATARQLTELVEALKVYWIGYNEFAPLIIAPQE
jgi:CheY-like chemotaxis protein